MLKTLRLTSKVLNNKRTQNDLPWCQSPCHVARLAVSQFFHGVEPHSLAHDHIFAFVKTVAVLSLCDVLSKKKKGRASHSSEKS